MNYPAFMIVGGRDQLVAINPAMVVAVQPYTDGQTIIRLALSNGDGHLAYTVEGSLRDVIRELASGYPQPS
ncbi:hypothetical protein [Sinorhizobium meliloti]|uniref:hypothetical protein n=1 Tax=Rhizobium meliloti TaxID=382 RepID=UPI0003DCE393|nr:hypothetical protein [Sinorhizobium meliloti]ARS72240.1 hypothetical protein SMRU11_35985 [Sinorhizobium meliloti RU11/001]RVI12006.1 hypothetical protein CN206_12735 [Sinorhizobium meliloti]RVI28977.1 hypothetical protein CN207_11920 [Sinorhizobium meliloti]RVL01911.1 hypothetical protein CN152_10780 [Sinorhizobium meliloti]RVM26765.1 hypothetical protein CN129_28805 [Sinorhizobium meliloti]